MDDILLAKLPFYKIEGEMRGRRLSRCLCNSDHCFRRGSIWHHSWRRDEGIHRGNQNSTQPMVNTLIHVWFLTDHYLPDGSYNRHYTLSLHRFGPVGGVSLRWFRHFTTAEEVIDMGS
jgi:hypothetical protein